VSTPSQPLVLRSDEVTLKAISFADGPVVIKATDEQAEKILRFHYRDAFLPTKPEVES
jgi:hypothetical protein